ncbi:MAG: DUF2165 family protein [Pseudomonadota bacterium]
MIRITKVAVALAIGVWGLIGLVSNLAALSSVYATVEKVTSMAAVPEGMGPPWATTNALVVGTGVLVIVLGKLAGLICGVGGIRMLAKTRASSGEFIAAKRWAIVGAGLAFALTFFGFNVMAEGVFFAFFGPEGGAGPLAFRFAAGFALAALFIAQPETDPS